MWWAQYGNLTWAFDPNLTFWSYLWTDLARITAAVSSEIAVEYIKWSVPLRDSFDLDSNYPAGYVTGYPNGSYFPTVVCYPEAIDNPGVPLENLTFVLTREGIQVLPPEYWHAEVYWERPNLSDAQWAALADQLSQQLNATWYTKSCVFDKEPYECGDAPWPFEAVILGLLVLLGIGYKRKRWRTG